MKHDERAALVGRVRELLEHWDSPGFEHVSIGVPVGDLRALCAEVERLAADAQRMREVLERIAGSPLQKALCESPTRRMEHLTNPCPHCTARVILTAMTGGTDAK